MNFFDAQDRARRKTRLLVGLFSLSSLLITLIIAGLATLIYVLIRGYGRQLFGGDELFQINQEQIIHIYLVVAIIVIAIIGFFSYRGFSQLFDGGHAVARNLGAKSIRPATTIAAERLALQAVAEMSLAAGCPVPEVGLLKERGVNAISMGWDSHDAVILITEGALKHLDRGELQALVAHEFSHILNGDMRLNFIMGGLLEGFFFIFETLSGLMKTTRISRRGTSNLALIYLAILALIGVGGLGHYIGRWIQARLTRQQSYEADAAAVQFTRNAEAVVRLLEKMGAHYANAYIADSKFEKFSHAFFAATGRRTVHKAHPPLEDRIQRISHNRETKTKPIDLYEPITKNDVEQGPLEKEKVKKSMPGVIAALAADEMISSAQAKTFDTGLDADMWVSLETEHYELVPDTRHAIALVLAHICASDTRQEDSRLKQLKPLLDASLFELMLTRKMEIQALDPRLLIPLLEICLPFLRELSKVQYLEFKKWLIILFNVDFTLDHDEFVVHSLIISRLDRYFKLVSPNHKVMRVLADVKHEYEQVLSLIAHTEHARNLAEEAFNAGRQSIAAYKLSLLPQNQVSYKSVSQALDTLRALPPALQKRLINACAATIAMDGIVTQKGFEILRVVTTCLGVPMPVMLRQSH